MSEIGAPEASSCLVSACLSSMLEAFRGRDPVRRAAARDEHQHEIVGTGLRGKRQDVGGGGEAGRIGHGVARLDAADSFERPPVAVAGDADAGKALRRDQRRVEIMALAGLRHVSARLAAGEHDEPAA